MWKWKRKRKSIERPRLVTILGWMLLLQAGMMLVLSLYHFVISMGGDLFVDLLEFLFASVEDTLVHQLTLSEFTGRLLENTTREGLMQALVESAALFLLTILALIAAVGFFRLWRNAWVIAVFVQAVVLGIGLTLYFTINPVHIYLLLISGVFMVFYLNYADVRSAFQKKTEEA